MQVVGKRPGQGVNAASHLPGVSATSRIIYVKDRASGRRFMVDSAADISVLPPTPTERHHPDCGSSLQAANRTSIKTYGQRFLNVDLGLRRCFPFIFTVADVPHSILGADFLHAFDLSVSVRRRRLTDEKTGLFVCGSTTDPVILRLSYLPSPSSSPYVELLRRFPSLTNPARTTEPAPHDIVHHIITTGPAKFHRFRRLAPEKQRIAEAEFNHMLQLGIIRPSSSK